jgi:carbon storage regulator
MLILRRKIGERLIIAGVIEIVVLEIEGQRVKLGISAPLEVSVVREELIHTPSPLDHYPSPQEHSPRDHQPHHDGRA